MTQYTLQTAALPRLLSHLSGDDLETAPSNPRLRDWFAVIAYGSAQLHVVHGRFTAARRLFDSTSFDTDVPLARILRAAVGIRLGTVLADEELLRRSADDGAIALAFSSGESESIGLLSGVIAARLRAEQREREASALRARALAVLQSARFSYTLLDEVAASDDSTRTTTARRLLERGSRACDSSGPDTARIARAYLRLFDARLAARQRHDDVARTQALNAVQAFHELGRPYEQAQALELAGCLDDASRLYERIGAARDLLRLSRPAPRMDTALARLTARQREVAMLVSAGHRSHAIACMLAISVRTVESHLAAVYDRLAVRTRMQLAAALKAHDADGDALVAP